MANPFQQRARQRKVIYLALIVVLFTGSLLHRRLVVQPRAEDLQLREVTKGNVELTSAFVRTSLLGSRGLATTILWSTAIDRMAKHEWNELEVLVKSISKLQPYFITPWVFQSWNMAFNVAVECDRPRDKYYYISRGLELLAEGERRNQGTFDTAGPGQTKFPGNPEMRHFMGFYYQLKIGTSDEKTTMRCLFDLSCIDPLERDPQKFYAIDDKGRRIVNREALQRLCNDHPRLVRRLREGLNLGRPFEIVAFLEDNKDVPHRFKKPAPGETSSDVLDDPGAQFPVLPPVIPPRAGWPDPRKKNMTPEALDVFLICRTWYQYAQEPLPPPRRHPYVIEEDYKHLAMRDRLRREKKIIYRDAKTMADVIFRQYPARAQIYIAENLESEGWFDQDGWLVQDWFKGSGAGEEDFRVGTQVIYHAKPAWETAYRVYHEFAVENGVYLTPAEIADLNNKAEAIRKHFKIGPLQMLPPFRPQGALGESYDAHQKLTGNSQARTVVNFDHQYALTLGEKDEEVILVRKLLYEAERLFRKPDYRALPIYARAWPLWVDACLRHRGFAKVPFAQEDVYDANIHAMRLNQQVQPDLFRAVMLGMTQNGGVWPKVNWERAPVFVFDDKAQKKIWKEGPWIDEAQKQKIVTVRVARGPIELVAYYDGPMPFDTVAVPPREQVVEGWCRWTAPLSGMACLGFTTPPVVLPEYALAGTVVRRDDDRMPVGWRFLIEADFADTARERLGMLRRPASMPPGGPPTPIKPVQPKP
jgi:hypothetical protein